MIPAIRSYLWVPLSFIGVFFTVVWLRPLLPIDETRYLTVAWEMFLRHDWLAPLTLNSEPYHHKPPLLFWLINMVWAITGPSRWSATIPPVLAGAANIYLTMALAKRLFPDNSQIAVRVPLIMVGCFAYLFYSSMVMFDVTLAFFVLSCLLSLISFSQSGKWRYVFLMALLLGAGVLTKGPVAYLYVIFPMLLAPLWQKNSLRPVIWYAGCLTTILLSIIPVLFWLVPVLRQSDNHFAFWLVWEQTAGRVTGNFNDAHVRPFYFYLPILPLLMVPWIFFPQLWREARLFRQYLRADKGLKFILCWVVPVFISFSLISGKQPHYLVPIVPGLVLLLAFWLRDLPVKTMQRTTAALYLIFIVGHVIGAQTMLKDYDLTPIAAYVRAHPDQDLAFVKKYHGEITFLARREKPIDVLLSQDEMPEWFKQHPQGLIIMRYKNPEDVSAYTELLNISYRGKTLGLFAHGSDGKGEK